MILQARNLSKHYDQAGSRIEILKDLSLEVTAGETVAILGESGSGKSTLLSLLAGLDRPDRGEIILGGTNLNDLDEDGLSAFRGRELGIVFQQFHLMSTLSALENISLPLEIAGDAKAQSKAREALMAVGLSHRATHLPHQMSGGECQRVAIARAFVTNPRLLLADEPSGNLDTETGDSVMKLLFDLVKSRGMTLVLVTHNQPLADRCQRRVRLRDGKLASE